MERYQQQLILPEIGTEGQMRLANTSVLVVGAGGLGVIVSSYLGTMGIGKIGICDFDKIEESNLHRQFVYTPNNLGQRKATVLSQIIQQQNPNLAVENISIRLDKNNIETVAGKYQIICDCTDQPDVRLLIDEYCEKLKKPLVHGAVSDWQGYITVFHYQKTIGLSDLFDSKEFFNAQTCSSIGINPAICGIIGSFMVNEVIKIILNLNDVIEGKLLYVNSLNNTIRKINLKSRTNNLLCKK